MCLTCKLRKSKNNIIFLHIDYHLENSLLSSFVCFSQGVLPSFFFYSSSPFFPLQLLTKEAAFQEEQLGWFVTLDSLGIVSEHCCK